ncbi:MAG: hypothetical protein HRT47_01165 [Candidatus Caenarcaniphilales bacterium]|nr:hypothetical protein [Candidatus Caenarcaniphilales bacterium]
MNSEFSSILSGQLDLQAQLGKVKPSSASRKVAEIVDSNTNIKKGAGTPIKSKTDYQEVIKVRESNIELKRLNNSINQLGESRSEVSSVSNNFDQAKEDLMTLKNILEDAKNGNLGPQTSSKQEEFNKLVNNLDDIAKNAKIGDKKVFDGNFNVTIPTGDDGGVSLDLTYNPDVVYDLQATAQYEQKGSRNAYDHFGEEVTSNSNYLVVGARDAKTFGMGEHRQHTNIVNQIDGMNYEEKQLALDDGTIQIFNKNTNESFRLTIGQVASKAGLDKDDWVNSQFGDSISIEGDKLIVSASRIHGKDSYDYNDSDTTGGAFIIDINEVYNRHGSVNARVDSDGVKFLDTTHVSDESFFGKDVELKDGKAYVSTFNGTGSTVSIYNASTGRLEDTIEAPEDSISFGYELEVTDDKLLVSGYIDDGTNNGTEVGAVYVYDKNDLSADPKVLRSPLEAQGYQFGNSLASFDNIVAIGEHKAGQGRNVTSSGAVHLYNTDTEEFTQSLVPTSTTLDAGDEFGSKISINDKFIAVSAAGDDDKGQDSGAVYIFDKATGVELAKITNADTDGFASSISLEGNKIYIGAENHKITTTNNHGSEIIHNEAGAVFEYDLSSLEVSDGQENNNRRVEPSINISAEDLGTADLENIANGDTSAADEMIAQVDGLLAGLDAFKGTVDTANSKLETKISTLENQKSVVLEQNKILNEAFESKKATQNEQKFFNPRAAKPETESTASTNQTLSNFGTNLNSSTANQLSGLISSFISNNSAIAAKAQSNFNSSTVMNLLSGII